LITQVILGNLLLEPENSPTLFKWNISQATSGMRFEVTRYDIGGLDRALADDHARGFVESVNITR